MKTLRSLHLYLGCIFAPMIIYFSLSGAWQIFRFNDVPKDEAPSALRTLLHNLSNPHTHSTMPGLSPKTDVSSAFNWIACAMSLGLVLTTLIGLLLAFKYSRDQKRVWICVGLGIVLPILLLWIR